MSSPLAIATVTSVLRNLLESAAHEDSELLDTTVTTQPPAIARSGNDANQLNVFLYSTTVNTTFSNSPMPGQTQRGESGIPPLSLVLKYLVTAYGRDNNDINGHRLMGRSMRVLHAPPILGKAEIEAALLNTDLHNQIEKVRVTHDPLSVDDMSKLWTSFQSEYRLSTGYDVSVVLIESSRPSVTPLPVLTRGIAVQPNLIPPFPTINEIELPNQQTSALLGDSLIIKGHHLDGEGALVRFTHARLENAIDVPVVVPDDITDNQIEVEIPNDPANWLVGLFTAEIVITKAGNTRITNVFPLSVSPIIDGMPLPNPLIRDAGNQVSLTISCRPEVLPEQRAALLLGDREVLANEHGTKTGSLDFTIENAPVGAHHIRLRIDGIDSLLIDRTDSPPVFDNTMLVTIQ